MESLRCERGWVGSADEKKARRTTLKIFTAIIIFTKCYKLTSFHSEVSIGLVSITSQAGFSVKRLYYKVTKSRSFVQSLGGWVAFLAPARLGLSGLSRCSDGSPEAFRTPPAYPYHYHILPLENSENALFLPRS